MKEHEEENSIRSQANGPNQAEMEVLRAQLAEAQQKVQANEGANDVIQDMLNKGELEFDQEGSIRVSKRKPGRPKSPKPN